MGTTELLCYWADHRQKQEAALGEADLTTVFTKLIMLVFPTLIFLPILTLGMNAVVKCIHGFFTLHVRTISLHHQLFKCYFKDIPFPARLLNTEMKYIPGWLRGLANLAMFPLG